MRGKAMATFPGFVQLSGGVRGVRALVLLAFAFATLALAPSALASTIYKPATPAKFTIALSGTHQVGGVAVDQATLDGFGNHDVYVAQRTDNKIAKYDSQGNLVTSWGTSGLIGATGTTAGGTFTTPIGIAVDQSDGSFYVVDSGNRRVQKFDATGKFVLMFGGGVNQTTAGNLCTAASGNTCKQGVAGSGNGAFGGTTTMVGIAVDPVSHDVYVADPTNNRIQRFDSGGNFKSAISNPGTGTTQFTNAKGVATDAAGNLYIVDSGNNRVQKFNSSGVWQWDYRAPTSTTTAFASGAIATAPDGTVLVQDTTRQRVIQLNQADGAFLNAFSGSGGANVPTSQGIAVDSSPLIATAYVGAQVNEGSVSIFNDFTGPNATTGASSLIGPSSATVAATVNPNSAATSYRFEYGTTNTSLPNSAPIPDAEAGSGSTNVAVTQQLTELAGNQRYFYRIAATGPNGTVVGDLGTFVTSPAPPIVATGSATAIVGLTAILNGTVNANNATTRYAFEYGPTTSYGKFAPSFGLESGGTTVAEGRVTGATTTAVFQRLLGLESGVTYHYRLVASNANGTVFGADETFTVGALPATPPSGRGYEMVSPVDKNGFSASEKPLSQLTSTAPQATDDGDAFQFVTRGDFAGLTGTFSLAAQPVVSRRGPDGWSSSGEMIEQAIVCPTGTAGGSLLCFLSTGTAVGPFIFSPDLSRSVQRSSAPFPGAPVENADSRLNGNLYLVETDELATPTLLTPQPPPPGATSVVEAGKFVAADPDFRHVVFLSNRALTPDSPGGTTPAVYEYDSVSGQTHLVSKVGGVGVAGTVGQTSGSNGVFIRQVTHAVSDDGSRIFFASPPEASNQQVYLRKEATETVAISTPQAGCSPACTSGKDQFWAGSPDGAEAVFTSTGRLTNDSVAGTNFYRWHDDGSATGQLTNLSNGPAGGAGVLGLTAATDDLGVVYFVSTAKLTADAGEGSGQRLYRWHDDGSAAGQLEFVHALSTSTEGNFWSPWSPRSPRTAAQVDPSGRYLLFSDTGDLTPESEGSPTNQAKAYLYDAEADQLTCVSCPPGGPQTAHAFVVPGKGSSTNAQFQGYYQTRSLAVTADGHVRVAFDTSQGLLPGDTNGVNDAYLWESGELQLMGTGKDPEGSYFMDMSANGDDYFLYAYQQLVGWDVDNDGDVYDARVGGGFPEPTVKQLCAVLANACQNQAPPAPADQAPGTASFDGPWNPQAAAPTAPKKKHHKKKHHKKRHHKHHRANQTTGKRG